MSSERNFRFLAGYNRWANRRLYAAAKTLPDDDYRKDVGLYFHSLHGTLNHLLVTDRIWLSRLTGEGEQPRSLNEILHHSLADLGAAREREDERIVSFVNQLTEEALEEEFDYRTLAGKPFRQLRSSVLLHLFNHQTHHRGQAHAALTILGMREPDPLDVLMMQRELLH